MRASVGQEGDSLTDCLARQDDPVSLPATSHSLQHELRELGKHHNSLKRLVCHVPTHCSTSCLNWGRAVTASLSGLLDMKCGLCRRQPS